METKSIFINKDFDQGILKTIISRYWWWLVVCVGITIGIAFVYLRYTKSEYASNLTLQIDNEDRGKEILEVENINSITADISKEIELLKSEFLFTKAIKTLNLNVSLYATGSILTEEKYRQSNFNITTLNIKDTTIIGNSIYLTYKKNEFYLNYFHDGRQHTNHLKIGETYKNKYFEIILKSPNIQELINELSTNELFFIFNSDVSLARKMLPFLFIEAVDVNAQTVSITYNSHNPQLSFDVVNAVAQAFIKYDVEIKNESSQKILSFIDGQLDSLSNEVENSKNDIGSFQRTSNIPEPDLFSANMSAKISKFQDMQFNINDEIRAINTVSSKLKSDPNRIEVYRLIPELMGKSFEGALSNSLNELYLLLEKKEDLLFKVTEENLEVKNINVRIQNKLTNLIKSVNAIEDRLRINMASINSNIAALEGQFYALPEKKLELGRLQNLQELNQKYFNLLTEKKVTYSISNAGFSSNNRILNPAVLSPIALKPNQKVVYTIFIVFGFFIGIFLLFFKYVSYNEINTIEDLKKLLPEKVSILGAIPLMKKQMEFSKLVVQDSKRSGIAEAMRNLRTNMSFINKDARTIAISSSISGEGKTFVALNLAGIIAMTGKKTVIIDLDMRKPKIHLGFGASNLKGMSTILTDQTMLAECIQKSTLENLSFITAGITPPNPSELILSKKFNEVIETLKTQFDVIVIDNPPIGIVSDGVNVLAEADIPIYIFKAHYSKRIFTRRVSELMEMQHLKKLNVILNGMPMTKSGYGYGYGFGQGYGYGYYDEEEGKKSLMKRILKR